ncbi:MAG TPA: AI-2E family transporter [Kofleriaceae bacterium]|nr:AI-2E family transporter [Kofleriaceae bacterium]
MSEEPRTTRIEVAPRTLLLVLLLGGAVWMSVRLWNVLLVMIVALVLVGTFDPLVAWLERRGLGRGRALALVFLWIALAFAAILLLTIPPLVAQLQHIIENAPAERSKLVSFLGQYKLAAPFVKTVKAVPIDDLVVRAGNTLLGYSGDILSAVGYAVTTLFLSLYLLADPGRAKALIYALVPRQYHVKLARILLELKVIVGGYMRGQVITSVAITIFTFGLLTVFKVDDALALAMFAGLTDVIPFVGGYVASAPAIISVSGQGTGALLIVAIAMILYQEFESRILVPRVYGRTLRLSPALVLVALLVGGTLLGILGALLALPVAAGLQMIVRELRVELPGEAHIDDKVRARDVKAERIYEQLTEGAPVNEAVAIAGRLAETIKANEADSRKVSAELTAMVVERKPE